MQDDPWSRRKTVKALAILDMILAVFLITYAVVRLLKYDYKDQNVVFLLSREENVAVSVLYWIVNFALLSLQLVIAFLLLTATIDMTTDPETMMKKCIWWRGLSILFFIMLSVDLIIILWEYLRNDVELKVFRTVLDTFEVLFRVYGVYFVGRFIRDLRSLFEAPMMQYENGTPIPPSPSFTPKFSKDRFRDRV